MMGARSFHGARESRGRSKAYESVSPPKNSVREGRVRRGKRREVATRADEGEQEAPGVVDGVVGDVKDEWRDVHRRRRERGANQQRKVED